MKDTLDDLAVFGGPRQFSRTLHVGCPNIGDPHLLFDYLNDMLDRTWLTNNGRYVQQFERRIAGRTLARWALGKSVGSITARPNPIRLSSDHHNGLGVTTVSWASAKLESAEVHIGAPNGPLFSRSGPSGRKEAGEWVRDEMLFYLQDVSGGLPLTRANTVATVTVSVTPDEAQASRSLM